MFSIDQEGVVNVSAARWRMQSPASSFTTVLLLFDVGRSEWSKDGTSVWASKLKSVENIALIQIRLPSIVFQKYLSKQH